MKQRSRWWTGLLRLGPRVAARVVVAAAVLLTVLLVITGRRPQAGRDGSGAPPRPAAAPATPVPFSPPPSPSAAAVAARAEPERRSASVTLPFAGAPPPAPPPSPPAAEPSDAPAPIPAATPASAVARCVTFRWSASPSPVSLGEVLVSIEAKNTCRQTFLPLDVWFQISAYRHGGLVTTLAAHPFDPLYGGGVVEVLAAVPGALDWVDRIEVRLTPTPEP